MNLCIAAHYNAVPNQYLNISSLQREKNQSVTERKHVRDVTTQDVTKHVRDVAARATIDLPF